MPDADQVEPPEIMDGVVLIPLCRTPGCDRLEGHDGEHGPVTFNMERAIVEVNKDRII